MTSTPNETCDRRPSERNDLPEEPQRKTPRKFEARAGFRVCVHRHIHRSVGEPQAPSTCVLFHPSVPFGERWRERTVLVRCFSSRSPAQLQIMMGREVCDCALLPYRCVSCSIVLVTAKAVHHEKSLQAMDLSSLRCAQNSCVFRSPIPSKFVTLRLRRTLLTS